MAKYYVDTCIWIDYWETRSDNLRPLGEFAAKFLSGISKEDNVVYTELTLTELRKRYSQDVLISIFSIVKKQLLFSEINDVDIKAATTLVSTGLVHRTDAIHIAVARRENAIFVTRDKEVLLSGLVEALKPEDLV